MKGDYVIFDFTLGIRRYSSNFVKVKNIVTLQGISVPFCQVCSPGNTVVFLRVELDGSLWMAGTREDWRGRVEPGGVAWNRVGRVEPGGSRGTGWVAWNRVGRVEPGGVAWGVDDHSFSVNRKGDAWSPFLFIIVSSPSTYLPKNFQDTPAPATGPM